MIKVNTINAHCTKAWEPEKNECIIYSYDTPVLSVDENGYHRLWSGYSATTIKDINSAGFPIISGYQMTKKEWDKMPIETI